MKKKRFYQISILVTTAILTIGCSDNKSPKPIKQNPIVNKPHKVVPAQPTGITLSQLNSGGVTRLALKGRNNFKQGEPINFIVDTKGAEGYLYVVYSDSNGNVGVLYPNPKSPLTEVEGKYIFPRDFGNMTINATKDCKGCQKERTVIYALLSPKPILDIQQIKQSQLSNILGGQSVKTSIAKTKGISMDLDAGTKTDNSNINIGVFEFFVE